MAEMVVWLGVVWPRWWCGQGGGGEAEVVVWPRGWCG